MLAARLLLLVAGVRSLQHTFKGFGTNYVKVSGTSAAPPVVLVHGFGGSSGQWRATLTDLAAAGRTVYAVDLLGFGDSPKPRLAAADAYSIELWADQLQHFVDEVVVAEDGADKATPRPLNSGPAALRAAYQSPPISSLACCAGCRRRQLDRLAGVRVRRGCQPAVDRGRRPVQLRHWNELQGAATAGRCGGLRPLLQPHRQAALPPTTKPPYNHPATLQLYAQPHVPEATDPRAHGCNPMHPR